MTSASFVLGCSILFGISLLHWVLRAVIPSRERGDGAPSLPLVRASEAVDLAGVGLLLVLTLLSAGRFIAWWHLWRHDVWSALLIGALAGFFLHVAGGGSPLPIASLRGRPRSPAGHAFRAAGPLTAVLFALGEIAAVALWFGVGLGTLLHALPRLVTLAVVAGGYGMGRAAAGQDHPLLGAIDGLLLALLALVSGSLIAAVVAHLIADLLAYVSAVGQADESETAADPPHPPHSALRI